EKRGFRRLTPTEGIEQRVHNGPQRPEQDESLRVRRLRVQRKEHAWYVRERADALILLYEESVVPDESEANGMPPDQAVRRSDGEAGPEAVPVATPIGEEGGAGVQEPVHQKTYRHHGTISTAAVPGADVSAAGAISPRTTASHHSL